MAAAAPAFTELLAPPAWRSVDFISDLHLQPGEPATFEAWRRFMAATPADAVFILGDLFEVWVGDDLAAAPGFAADCAAVIAATAQRAPVFLMHGNRDFLIGEGFARACGATLLADPAVLGFAGQRVVLTHGDALCLDDTDYMAFRAQVRDAAWQQAFLARPAAEREALGREMRRQSEARKREQGPEQYADLDAAAVQAWLDAADARAMMHGHTHRPATHALAGGRERIVLSDWDAAAQPPRLQALRLSAAGAQRIALA